MTESRYAQSHFIWKITRGLFPNYDTQFPFRLLYYLQALQTRTLVPSAKLGGF